MILDRISKPNDIKKIKSSEYPALASEIRRFLIENISKTGGHLASNLGVVELTMALHLVCDFPDDKIIWDVGHQSYTHKILTGRKNGFTRLRKFGGMSGFPKRCESDSDVFDTGHSSTSISAGLGFATARDIAGDSYKVISVIGDGALTGGMAFEALNNAARIKRNFMVVLNDNEMSIAENVGAISNVLNELRTSDKYAELKERLKTNLSHMPRGEKIASRLKRTKHNLKMKLMPGQIVESLGITYFGPVDGHDISRLVKTFNAASRVNGPVLVHVKTKKGKGYAPAERKPDSYHGVSPFDVATGKAVAEKKVLTYAGVFSEKICQMAEKNKKIVGITAAMPDGVGLKRFSKEFPNRYFDVGIAEEHAATFAAGLAAGGMIPVFGVYSSFIQRAFDQVLHDVCIQNLKVIFALDHAGLVGSDGETHQGIFDLSFLSAIPGMTIFAPKNGKELEAAMEFAIEKFDRPIALRYPSGKASSTLEEFNAPIVIGRSEMIYKEKDIALVAVGRMIEIAISVRNRLKEEGWNVTLVNARFVKPLDRAMIKELSREHKLIVTLEENVLSGGFGEHVCEYVMTSDVKVEVLPIALPNDYIEHGNVKLLFSEAKIDTESVLMRVKSAYNNITGIETDKDK
ncbi:MAG: 1-deoxy-D-xylulose-5-phosphate synthase [Clostridiales bacterium]|nr:1-deoxy-D-xylulose-5-phosphate synthase [Clostridiales bacterium]MDU1041797.1 1-deoxy-D-xylulose-5-phosphate synthase [Clostridiales bacterium]